MSIEKVFKIEFEKIIKILTFNINILIMQHEYLFMLSLGLSFFHIQSETFYAFFQDMRTYHMSVFKYLNRPDRQTLIK